MSWEIGGIWGQNNSYFLGLEKQRKIKKYTTNYPEENLTSNYIFDTQLENRLQDQDQSICDGKVTEEECSNAINNMKSNKAPGLDGLTV